jgi:hypothetical protein
MEESVQSLLFLVVSPCLLSYIGRYLCFRGIWSNMLKMKALCSSKLFLFSTHYTVSNPSRQHKLGWLVHFIPHCLDSFLYHGCNLYLEHLDIGT